MPSLVSPFAITLPIFPLLSPFLPSQSRPIPRRAISITRPVYSTATPASDPVTASWKKSIRLACARDVGCDGFERDARGGEGPEEDGEVEDAEGGQDEVED